MNYVILYIRLDSYTKHRAQKKGTEVSDKELRSSQTKERVATWIFTTFIVGYPTAAFIILWLEADNFIGNVILYWEHYEVFYMFSFIGIAVLLVASTFLSLSHMRKVFGEQTMKEERSIKVLLLVFCFTYAMRVVFAIMFHVKVEWVTKVYNNSNTFF